MIKGNVRLSIKINKAIKEAKRRRDHHKKSQLLAYINKHKSVLRREKLQPVMQALKNTNVPFTSVNAKWIESYRSSAVKHRGTYVELALEAMAQMESIRKANDHLVNDYGMPYEIDTKEAFSLILKTFYTKMLRSLLSDLPEQTQLKALETYAGNFTSNNSTVSPQRLAPKNSPFSLVQQPQSVSFAPGEFGPPSFPKAPASSSRTETKIGLNL